MYNYRSDGFNLEISGTSALECHSALPFCIDCVMVFRQRFLSLRNFNGALMIWCKDDRWRYDAFLFPLLLVRHEMYMNRDMCHQFLYGAAWATQAIQLDSSINMVIMILKSMCHFFSYFLHCTYNILSVFRLLGSHLFKRMIHRNVFFFHFKAATTSHTY